MLKKCPACGLSFAQMNEDQIYLHSDWCQEEDTSSKNSRREKESDRRRNGRRREKSYQDFE